MKIFAKISGIGYLIIFIFGFYSNFAILETLVNLENSQETTHNLINHTTQFRNGLIGFLVMLLADILLIWSLYPITKPINKKLTLIASLFRGIHALFFAVALVRLWKAYYMTKGAINDVLLQHRILDILISFDKLWTIGLLFFGVHLGVLGLLSLKSKTFPRFIGWFLIGAAFGYFIDGLCKLFLPYYNDYQFYFEVLVICTAVVGELSLTLWLLTCGFSKKYFH